MTRTPARMTVRIALLLATTMALLAASALPALAADAATKPSPDTNPFLIGSLAELAIAAVCGAIIGVVAIALRPAGPAEDHDDHH